MRNKIATALTVSAVLLNAMPTSSLVSYAESPAPIIMNDPVNVTGKIGDTVEFKIVADNAVEYQWQYSSDGGVTFNNTKISGYNTDTISVYLKNNYYLNYFWRCIVTGSDGKTSTSNYATTIKPAIITSEPSNVTGNVGDAVDFHVTAANAVKYQWQYSTNSGESYSNTKFPGFDTDTMSVTLKNKYYFNYLWRCAITVRTV